MRGEEISILPKPTFTLEGHMTTTITGRLTGSKTIQLDSPLITDKSEILIKLKKAYTRKKSSFPNLMSWKLQMPILKNNIDVNDS
jgi:hypothetical protein